MAKTSEAKPGGDGKNLTLFDIVARVPIWVLAVTLAVFLSMILWSVLVSRVPFQIASTQFGAVPGPVAPVTNEEVATFLASDDNFKSRMIKVIEEDLKKDERAFAFGPDTEDWRRKPVPNKYDYITEVTATTRGRPVWIGLVPGTGDSYMIHLGKRSVYTFIRIVRDSKHEVAKFRFQPPIDGIPFELPPSSIQAVDLDPPDGEHRYSLEAWNSDPAVEGNELQIFRARLVAFELPGSGKLARDKARDPDADK
jgi:hypothetical protein